MCLFNIIPTSGHERAGPIDLVQACKTIFSCLAFVALNIIPTLVVASITLVVFIVALPAFLAGFSVLVGHDPNSSHASYFQADFTKHFFKIVFLGTRIHSNFITFLVFFLSLGTSVALLLIFVYERRRIAKELNCEIAPRVAFEKAIAQARRTTQVCTKQLADVDASLACMICVDRLTQPYTLAPCGHSFDLECLQSWFRTAHPSPADEQLAFTLDPRGALFALRRKKFCPLCHAEVVGCPAPARALLGLGMTPSPEDENPWKGLFVGARA
ncbi:hypothetical protein B0H11DRAFT_712728 [Mycena galericulata]|nr:hypothetical protein B0H11DRAFT_712728 [Mycena galericulata]